jgi:hypothetical protein
MRPQVNAKLAKIRGQPQMSAFTECTQRLGGSDLDESNDEYFY